MTPPEPRKRKSRRQRRKAKEGALSELSCCAVSIDFGYVEEDEDEESPLASGMDEEEVLADLRTEREAEEMLRWYSGQEAEASESEKEVDSSVHEDEVDPTDPFVVSVMEYLVRHQCRSI